ncbi:hypothetical protein GE09DRAFT_1214346 [Coniochaeta sp. 2T2.1]|nr:hypothetical protein GE09DRAFT_1214346 [Coniochaeta sp. 2T2.1]
MGRSKKSGVAKERPVIGQESSASRNPTNQPQKKKKANLKLHALLPRVGFDWQAVRIPHPVPDLRQDFVYRLQDASYDKCDELYTFGVAMTKIIARSLELFEQDVAELDPIEVWKEVQDSFEPDDFANHPRITAEVLHAFVAYSIEAREYWTQDDEKNDVYLGHHQMVAVVDIFINKLEMDDMASAREAYLTRPKEARWVLNNRTGGQSTVTDSGHGHDGNGKDGDGADKDNGEENVEDDQMADSDEEKPEGEGIEEIEQQQSSCAVYEDEDMQDVTEELTGGIAVQNGEGMEFGGNEMEGVEETGAQVPAMTLSFRPRSG